jgi:pyruvate formate lyase activating enzyme
MTLAEILAQLTKEGELYEKLSNRRVRCYACGHRCLIPEGRQGVCRVRFNKEIIAPLANTRQLKQRMM